MVILGQSLALSLTYLTGVFVRIKGSLERDQNKNCTREIYWCTDNDKNECILWVIFGARNQKWHKKSKACFAEGEKQKQNRELESETPGMRHLKSFHILTTENVSRGPKTDNRDLRFSTLLKSQPATAI